MTTAHHITNENLTLKMKTALKEGMGMILKPEEEEVEGETILLGRKENENNWSLYCAYACYMEALKKYDEKEEIKRGLYLARCKNGGFANYEREEKYIKNKKARDKKFKKKWTEILDEADLKYSNGVGYWKPYIYVKD